MTWRGERAAAGTPPGSLLGPLGDVSRRPPPPGAASPERWPRPAVTTPSVSSRRARRPPPSSSSSPPSASQPTCHGRTLRTSTAWPGTRRSRGCSPPAATMARSPSGSTNSPRGAEGLGRRGVAVLLLKPAAVTGKGMGVTNLCPTSPSAVWTPAFLQVNFVRPKSHSSSARSGGGGMLGERGERCLSLLCAQ